MSDFLSEDNLPVPQKTTIPVRISDRNGALIWSIIDENMGPFLRDFVVSIEESGFSVEYDETDDGYEITVDNYYLLTIKVERVIND